MMIASVALILCIALPIQQQDDPASLLQSLKTKLGPEIERFEKEAVNAGPAGNSYSAEIIKTMLQFERDRFLSLFADTRLRPLRLSVAARFELAIVEAENFDPNSDYRDFPPRRNGDDYLVHQPDPFVVSLVSRLASFLRKVETLPSLVKDITVQSEPSGAKVGFFIGNDLIPERELDTPGVVHQIYLGKYSFKVERKTYQARTMGIDLLNDNYSLISCALRKEGDPVGTTCLFR